jgi:hypothetical protein
MGKKKRTILMALVLIMALTGCQSQNDFPELSGPYLGQDPPGMTPEIFAPGILSKEYSEIKAVFSPDGREIYYQLWGEPFPVIVTMKEENGRWTEPEMASFSGQIIEGYNMSPDGKKMFICSQLPLSGQGEPSEDWRVWVTEKQENGWGELEVLKPSIFGYPAVAENGNLYLATGDIWISEYVDGDYTEMKKLSNSINTDKFHEEDLYIAPDESYLLFCRRDDGYGSWDIFASFRRPDGTWTKAKNMGDKINSSVSEVYPFVTPDGKYLFYSSRKTTHKPFSPSPITYHDKLRILDGPGNGNADIYWVDARIIDEIKQDELSAAVDEDIVEAAKNGNLNAVQAILEKDPSMLNAKNRNGYTPLHWACMRAHWDVAKYLVQKGADLNVVGGDGGTQVNWAVHHDNVDMIQFLFENGAKLNNQNQWGMTELHTAIWRGNINVVKFLLDQGSDPEIKTNEGWTAMHYAYRSGHDNIIEMLKNRGLSMTAKDSMGRTPQYLYFKKPNPIVLTSRELDEYVGKYYVGDYLLLEVWREGAKLKIMEFGPDEIYPAAKDFFYFKQAPWTLIFSRDENGEIHHAQLSFIRRSYTVVKK